MPERRAEDATQSGRPPCPICQRAADPVFRPFCSKRCADVDLHRWLNGSYRIESDDEPDETDTSEGRDPRQ